MPTTDFTFSGSETTIEGVRYAVEESGKNIHTNRPYYVLQAYGRRGKLIKCHRTGTFDGQHWSTVAIKF